MKVNVRGIDLVYDDEGRGPSILFLHGFPFNRSMWRDQIIFLTSHGYRCVAPDLRGLGESALPHDSTGASTMEEIARDCGALLHDLQIDRAVICGLSMGSYVALEFDRLFREHVQALILAGARAQDADDEEKRAREQQAQRVLMEGMEFAVPSISTRLLAPRTVAEKPEVVARVTEMVLHTSPAGAAAAQRGMALRRDYSRDLAEIKTHTLIIAGRDDGVREPADAKFLSDHIADSHLEVIDDAGHLMNLEQPEIFNELLIRFLHPS